VWANLLLAKDLLGHGNFATWLDREFGLSRRSAEQFMTAARRFGSRSARCAVRTSGYTRFD